MESIKSINKYYFPLNHKADIDFFVLDSHIYTTNALFEEPNREELLGIEPVENLEPTENIDPECINFYLVIEIESELNVYSSTREADEKARPRYLIILSILSFFTGELFTVAQNIKGSSEIVNKSLNTHQEVKTLFIYNGINRTDDLSKVLVFINTSSQSSKRLIYSLFDRWRKALCLETESEDTFLYEDEALLAYYHILELLSSEYSSQLKEDTEILINNFLEELLGDIFHLSKNNIEQEKSNKIKLIKEILISEIPIKIKIYFMLKKLRMLNSKSREIVEKLIKDRNLVAHGREVYQDNIIFPLPPFFPLVKDLSNEILIAKIISARAIASHLGLSNWKKEWTNLLKNLALPYEVVDGFIQNKYYLNIFIEEFINGKFDKVRPSNIFYYTVAGKIKFNKFQEIVCQTIINTEVNKRNALELLGSCVLLSDSQNYELCVKCREIIKTSYEKEWIDYLELRDIFKYLENKKIKEFNGTWVRQLLFS